MEMLIKKVNLLDDRCAVIKTNWLEKEIIYEVFVQKDIDEWTMYHGKCELSMFESHCKKFKVLPTEVKECFKSKENLPDIHYELDVKRGKFLVLFRERTNSFDGMDESFIEHTYACLSIEEARVSTNTVIDLVLELQKINEKYYDQCEEISRLQANYKYIQESFEDLKNKHLASEKKLMTNFLHLLNSKKLHNSTPSRSKTVSISSSDSEKKNSKNKSPVLDKHKLLDSNKQRTPKKSSSSLQELKKTSSTKRTPSKSLLSQILSITSDSDSESVGFIKKSGTSSRNLFNSRELKVKINEREMRESSIELKKTKNLKIAEESASSIVSSTSENEGYKKKRKNFNIYNNAQNLLKISEDSEKNSDTKGVENEVDRKRDNNKNAKKRKLCLGTSDDDKDSDDPYACETVNILKNI